VVAAPQYRAAVNTAMGWKNSNLRTEMTRLLRRAAVSGWPRLFRSVTLQEGRASRQTELQHEFPLHVVCSRGIAFEPVIDSMNFVRRRSWLPSIFCLRRTGLKPIPRARRPWFRCGPWFHKKHSEIDPEFMSDTRKGYRVWTRSATSWPCTSVSRKSRPWYR
jgi:hypothetical protein